MIRRQMRRPVFLFREGYGCKPLPPTVSPDALIRSEMARWAPLIRKLGLKSEWRTLAARHTPHSFVRKQPVANAGFSDEMARPHRVRFELVAQLLHVDAQIVGVGRMGRTPDLGQ